jgi:hypothetical protein
MLHSSWAARYSSHAAITAASMRIPAVTRFPPARSTKEATNVEKHALRSPNCALGALYSTSERGADKLRRDQRRSSGPKSSMASLLVARRWREGLPLVRRLGPVLTGAGAGIAGGGSE